MKKLLVLVAVLWLAGCGGSSGSGSKSLYERAATFNLFTAFVDGSGVEIKAVDPLREMTHPRITSDRQWLAFTRFNTIGASGYAEEKGGTYTNTEIVAIKMDGSGTVNLTLPVVTDLSTNSYWIDNTFDFTYLEGPPGSIQIMRSYRDTDLAETAAVEAVPVPGTIIAFDPHQSNGKIVFAGQYYNGALTMDVKSIFTMDPDGGNLTGITVASDTLGAPVDASLAWENDPKLSPNGTQIAFMRKIDSANGHGWHLFVIPTNGVPGDEVDISDAHIGTDPNFNDGVPEWIDDTTLVFFTLNIVGLDLVQKLYTMKTDGSQRTEIPLPAGFQYSHVFSYRDALNNVKLVFAARKN